MSHHGACPAAWQHISLTGANPHKRDKHLGIEAVGHARRPEFAGVQIGTFSDMLCRKGKLLCALAMSQEPAPCLGVSQKDFRGPSSELRCARHSDLQLCCDARGRRRVWAYGVGNWPAACEESLRD